MAATGELACDIAGSGGVPLALLHGFASTHAYWTPTLPSLTASRQVLAYDLPGHGGSRAMAGSCRTAEAAETLLADLDRRGIRRCHLAGHSMGGAIAVIMALKQPERIASLTLLAPGGFGPEINAKLIRRFAVAGGHEVLLPLFEQFYGWTKPVNETALHALIEDRRDPQAADMHLRFAEQFLDGDRQGVLALDALAALTKPVTVIWGTQDRITPTRQAHKLPGMFATHVFDGVGHSIADEITDETTLLIERTCRSAQ